MCIDRGLTDESEILRFLQVFPFTPSHCMMSSYLNSAYISIDILLIHHHCFLHDVIKIVSTELWLVFYLCPIIISNNIYIFITEFKKRYLFPTKLSARNIGWSPSRAPPNTDKKISGKPSHGFLVQVVTFLTTNIMEGRWWR